MKFRSEDRPLVSAGLLLGIGMGGFVDGIVFHQILQLHNMLSAKRPPDTLVNIQVNMVWDGLFHAFTWATTAVGLLLLFRAARRPGVNWSGRILLGSSLAGWGLFNLVEGVIDHHLLHVHHVVERLGVSIWDWAFLGSGVALLASGWWLIGTAQTRSDRQLTV
jgi:uncharacterized membrane protein